jgi:hypothetical protein
MVEDDHIPFLERGEHVGGYKRIITLPSHLFLLHANLGGADGIIPREIDTGCPT